MKKAENKTALVAGSGRAIAITLAKERFNVTLTGRREEKLREVEKEIEKGRVIVLPADVTNEQSVQEQGCPIMELS